MHAILRTSDRLQAQVVADQLMAAGIRAEVIDTDSAFAGAIGGGQISVVVADAEASRAQQILESEPQSNPTPTPPWRCSCGEQIEAGFDACWKCGALNTDAASEPTAALEVPPPQVVEPPPRDVEPPGASRRGGRAMLWLELSAVLSIGWLYYLLGAFAALERGQFLEQSNVLSLGDAVLALGICLMITWIVARRGDLERNGIVRPRMLDLGFTAVVLMLTVGIEFAGVLLLSSGELARTLDGLYGAVDGDTAAAPFVFDTVWLGVTASVVWYIVAAAGEEFVRVYLLSRLADLTGSALASTLVSTALFASYHCYQGAAGMTLVFVFGLAMALAFWLTRRVWPLVLVHAIMNIFFTG